MKITQSALVIVWLSLIAATVTISTTLAQSAVEAIGASVHQHYANASSVWPLAVIVYFISGYAGTLVFGGELIHLLLNSSEVPLVLSEVSRSGVWVFAVPMVALMTGFLTTMTFALNYSKDGKVGPMHIFIWIAAALFMNPLPIAAFYLKRTLSQRNNN
jgi:hypothetical protein